MTFVCFVMFAHGLVTLFAICSNGFYLVCCWDVVLVPFACCLLLDCRLVMSA